VSFGPAAALLGALCVQVRPELLLDATEAALAGKKSAALSTLSGAGLDPADHDALAGLIHLTAGDRRAARGLLKAPRLAAYRAMAEQGDPGGLGRAREILAKAAEAEDAEPETLFLAALAFSAEGQAETADRLLSRALKKASALDPAWAPDPAARLALEVERILSPLSSELGERLQVALQKAGRTGAVVRRAERPAVGLQPLLGKALPPGVEAAKDLAEAEAHLREDPSSLRHRAALIDVLIKEGNLERAEAMTHELLQKRPPDLDPYVRFAKIAAARGQAKKAEVQQLRSQGHREQLDRRRAELSQRERALLAVADAESGVGIAGLENQRREHIRLSLPFDLAIARQGKPGEARAARDRILSACGARLSAFLEHQGPWEQFQLRWTIYGKPENIQTRLPAADPGRCAAPR
jgi:hypothetical protein